MTEGGCVKSLARSICLSTPAYTSERAQNSIFYIVGREQCDQFGIKN